MEDSHAGPACKTRLQVAIGFQDSFRHSAHPGHRFPILIDCRRMSFVQIQCTRCKTMFRDRAGRLQDGYSRQCPGCEVVLFFGEDSPHPFIKRAMRNARKVRKEQYAAEAARRSAPPEQRAAPRSRSSTGRSRLQERSD